MINVIWQTEKSNKSVISNETDNQLEYITKVLFKNFDFINHFDNKEYKTFLDNSIIIYPAWNRLVDDIQSKYFETYRLKKLNYILFHISNEFLNHDYSYYSNANHVFRFHYDPNIKLNNVITFPMGFLTGYMNNSEKINLSKDRNILVTFIGDLKHDRHNLVNNIQDIDNKFIHCTRTWGDSNMLQFNEVINIYKKTLFVPIPLGYGNRDETCRPYEALEWGSIPIIKKVNGEDFYKPVLGEHPLPTINEWHELKPLMNKLLNNNIDDLIIKINEWWTSYKEKLAKDAGDIVMKEFNK